MFGIYPYIALAVFLVGSLIRYDRDQYTWKSDSSQLLRRGQLRWGSNLFHLGILGCSSGTCSVCSRPKEAYTRSGSPPPAKQMLAIVAGGVFGVMCLVGLLLLGAAGSPNRASAPPRRAWTSSSCYGSW